MHNAHRFYCTTHDNIIVSGFVVHRPHARRILVVCHGYSRSKESMLPLVEMFPHDTLVLFDFRAHGESTGNIISFSIHESADIHAVIKYIKMQNDLSSLPIYGIGVSMGAASLVKAAHEGAPLKALVIDSSFAELTQQLQRSWKHKTRLPIFLSRLAFQVHEWIIGSSFSNGSLVTLISKVKIPVYVIHADKDWFVPVSDALALYNAAQAQKQLWLIDSTKHACNFTENPQEYTRRIDEFFDSVTL